jgi:mannosyltransferase
MKIFLDNIIYSKTKHGGISNYWYELSKYLLENDKNEVNFFQENTDLTNFHRSELNISNGNIIQLENKNKILSRLLPIKHASEEKFIYHSSYYRALSGSKNKIEVTTVYDFIHNYYFPLLKRIVHNNLKYNAIKRSKGVICISKNTYADLQKFCPTKASQKAEVIYVGVSNDYFPLQSLNDNNSLYLKSLNLESGFFLFVGGRTNYKNFDFVVDIINNINNIKLVVVGGGNLSNLELNKFTKEALARTVFIGAASNNELNVLFNNALSLIYPSSYEGFGIPVVEAMRAGCPVIGLNNATIREVAENSAILLEKLSLKEFENNLIKLKNKDFRQEIIQKGLIESKKYSWEKCSRETAEFYQNLY